MAFGLMTKKWGILQRLLTTKLSNDKWIVIAIARLHNFVINERLAAGERTYKADDKAVVGCMKTFRRIHQPNSTVGSVRIRGNSAARLLMVERVKRMGLTKTRPAKNKLPST
jgi:hypothetical protein